jgi:hypothetical protein
VNWDIKTASRSKAAAHPIRAAKFIREADRPWRATEVIMTHHLVVGLKVKFGFKFPAPSNNGIDCP